MDLKAILFDVNGTLIDILTDDHMIDIFRKLRNFLTYQGIFIGKTELHDLYFQIMKEQKRNSKEKHAEFDAVAVWQKILDLKKTATTTSLAPGLLKSLPLILAQFYRSSSFCRKLQLYPDVIPTLDKLKKLYPLGIVTNAQSAWGLPELRSVGLGGYFDPIIVSGDYGFCKPDVRLFQKALDYMRLLPENVIYVGNDMYHDVVGAKQTGMKAIFFASNQGDQSFYDVHPDYIIRNFCELPQAIEFLKKS